MEMTLGSLSCPAEMCMEHTPEASDASSRLDAPMMLHTLSFLTDGTDNVQKEGRPSLLRAVLITHMGHHIPFTEGSHGNFPRTQVEDAAPVPNNAPQDYSVPNNVQDCFLLKLPWCLPIKSYPSQASSI